MSAAACSGCGPDAPAICSNVGPGMTGPTYRRWLGAAVRTVRSSVGAGRLTQRIADRARGDPEAAAQRRGQVAVVSEAEVGGDRGERRLPRLDALERRGDAEIDEVPMHRAARLHAERASQVIRGVADELPERRQGPRTLRARGEGRADPFDGGPGGHRCRALAIG